MVPSLHHLARRLSLFFLMTISENKFTKKGAQASVGSIFTDCIFTHFIVYSTHKKQIFLRLVYSIHTFSNKKSSGSILHSLCVLLLLIVGYRHPRLITPPLREVLCTWPVCGGGAGTCAPLAPLPLPRYPTQSTQQHRATRSRCRRRNAVGGGFRQAS